MRLCFSRCSPSVTLYISLKPDEMANVSGVFVVLVREINITALFSAALKILTEGRKINVGP